VRGVAFFEFTVRTVAGVLSSNIAPMNIIGNQNNIGMTRTPSQHVLTKPCASLRDMLEQPEQAIAAFFV
jgi:hypothetical protein